MPNQAASDRIAVVGAGLAGALMGLYLHQRGLAVDLIEKRDDMRQAGAAGGRSINLALSLRGLRALEAAGLKSLVMQHAIPMRGRMIHDREGQQQFQPYSQNPDEVIYSVSRAGLNQTLMNAFEEQSGQPIRFDQQCAGMDLSEGTLHFVDKPSGEPYHLKPATTIATDGANSAVRHAMQFGTRFNLHQTYLEHGYKELTIPPNEDGSYAMEPNALHIWPRGAFMMIALPNPDGSFTCTLFLPFNADPGFDQLQTPEQVNSFFQAHFPDVIPLMPRLKQAFFENPLSWLITIKCWPWQHEGRALLLGDSAHAIVPFYGQGMNACFEDCRLLNETLDAHAGKDWATIFEAFQHHRKPDADAIADLAMDNFLEMRDKTADPVFVKKRQLELQLEEQYPDQFFSKYRMVTFSHRPYSEALRLGRLQDEILMDICREVETIEALDLAQVFERVQRERQTRSAALVES